MTTYRFGPLRLDKEQLLLSANGEALSLGPKVVETLLALVEHPQRLVTKSELLERIWPEGFVEEANLAQNIYVIRKTLKAHWPQGAIETVPRRGYRFAGNVAVETAHAGQPAPPRRRPRPQRLAAVAAMGCAVVIATLVSVLGIAGSHPQSRAAAGLSSSGERLYTMGRYYWNQRTAAGIAKSERYFTAVIAEDPRDARGYAGLASAYAIQGDYGYGKLHQKEAISRAAAYARKALSLDPQSSEAYAVLGLVSVDRGRMDQGSALYRRALALDPRNAAARQWYGAALLLSGKALAGFDELQKAADLDPESVAATDWLAHAAFISRRYGDAVAYARQALDLSPQRYGVYQTIGMAYEALGNERAAISAYKKYARGCKACGYDAAALLAHAYARSHDFSEAQSELGIARDGMPLHEVSTDNMVAALIVMGRKTEALDMLRRGKLDEPAALIAIDPRMDALRGDARFRLYTRSPG